MYLIFDTETTGLPKRYDAPVSDTSNWPRMVQLAWQLHDEDGKLIAHKDFLVRPDDFDIPFDAERIHGISTILASTYGVSLEEALSAFKEDLLRSEFVVGHNVDFDLKIVGSEFYRNGLENQFEGKKVLDTCTTQTAEFCRLPGGRGGGFKLPTLSELYGVLFDAKFEEAHNATADVEATSRCFLELLRIGQFSPEHFSGGASYLENFSSFNPAPFNLFGLKHLNLRQESEKLRKKEGGQKESIEINLSQNEEVLVDVPFIHLHNHTQFSLLQSTSTVKGLVQKAIEYNMPAVALTDTGNMMAAFHFEKEVAKYNKQLAAERQQCEAEGKSFDKKELLPIIGCEFNICQNMDDKSFKDNGSQLVFLAKNKKGYQNLVKLSSQAFTRGFYYVPRIDKALLQEYKSDLIVLSGNLNGEIPSTILNVGEKQAEEALLWWKNEFGEDFYLEIMRHGQDDEERVNEVLLRFSKEHDVKIVATNNTFYLNPDDSYTHDLLLCVRDNELVTTPKGRGRGYRHGFQNNEYYFKTQEQMKALFVDLPEAIININELVQKCSAYQLARQVLLPVFDIPDGFKDPQDMLDGGKRGENNYLRHLSYEGALTRYGEITNEIKERLDFELATIERTGYPGYFLIVQDFCRAARDMGVTVGPGRGSAAGSVVAYCTGITNIDPIKYDLLFERFLNPDRISMPDIDIDFDDEGRGKVIDWVIEKYGANQVAQIITYGTMAAKSSIRDTARVMDVPLDVADRVAKLVPELPPHKLTINKLLDLDEDALFKYFGARQDDYAKAKELIALSKGNDKVANMLQQARKLEGTMRNTGIHPCGVIITPDDLSNFVPIATAKDSEMYCTQYDNSVAEEAGLLKMDFLGLKTLTLIKHAVQNVKKSKGIELDPEDLPIDDEKTYELFQRGETIGIFQYESPGMQKYMRELKPTVFGDLIAMNALYRPGPLEYIPLFIRRKHGVEEITYDLADCEEFLKETYGITVYQEQVMLLSQKLADFTKGEADTLRKAMGKKDLPTLEKMKPLFMERGGGKGHAVEVLEKIWKDWEAFASYAFNKSHSTCYAWVAYQTAYLKSNYPAEFMASVLSNNMSDIKQVGFFMEECRRMGIDVLGPDVNESAYHFAVNKEGAIRFGLGAIKGLGTGPVHEIVAERETGGLYKGVFDLVRRLSTRVCNKKALESMVYAGCFDSFGQIHRAQYFQEDGGRTFLENLIRYANSFKESESSLQGSLFGGDSGVKMPEPVVPNCEEWTNIYALNKERDVIGMFISGHPLDDYKYVIQSFCRGNVGMLNDLEANLGREFIVAGIITSGEHRLTKRGEQFGTLFIEDYHDSSRINLWRDSYLKHQHFLKPGVFVYISGRIVKSPRRTEPELSIHSIDLLDKLMRTKVKSLSLKVNSRDVTHVFIEDLGAILTEFPGECPVQFNVYDELEDVELKMPSRTLKVELKKELFKRLENFDLKFVLN